LYHLKHAAPTGGARRRAASNQNQNLTWKDVPAMDGSTASFIAIPIVTMLAVAAWGGGYSANEPKE